MSVPRPFKKRQEFYTASHGKQNCWRNCYTHIISALQLLSHYHCKTIVELGCNTGDLAVKCLENLAWEPTWTGYDISKYFIEKSVTHNRYHPVLLDAQLWNTDLPKFDIFVSSHTLEHLYPDEIKKLAVWLEKHTRFLVFCLPAAWSYSRVHHHHVNPKGIEWLRDLLLATGFRLVFHTAHYFGWYAHNKEPLFR